MTSISGNAAYGAAFENFTSLTNVTFSTGLLNFDNVVFNGCTSLTSLIIPGSVTNIGMGAFGGCTKLTNVVIANGSGPTSLGYEAFGGCTNLASVTISAGVTNFGCDPFEGCTKLTSIYFEGNAPYVSYDCLGMGCYPANPTVYYLPCMSGWSSTFDLCPAVPWWQVILNCTTNAGAITITGPTGMCWPLSALNLPALLNGLPVTSIGTNAFAGNAVLTSVTIPATVNNIGASALGGCSNLTSVCFYGNAPSAEPTAFTNDNNATVYYLPCANGWSSTFDGLPAQPWWQVEFTYTTNAGAATITGSSGLCSGNLAIPATIAGLPVRSIGSYAFSGSTNLTGITIPGSVTNIGSYAFYQCYSLTNVTILNGVTSIGYEAFIYCTNLASLVIPNSVTSIGNYAFSYCSHLTSVTIPSSVTNFDLAFDYCGLTSVTIMNGVKSIGYRAFY